MRTTKLTFFDRIMMAITFAEAGEAETARNILFTREEMQRREKKVENRPALEL